MDSCKVHHKDPVRQIMRSPFDPLSCLHEPLKNIILELELTGMRRTGFLYSRSDFWACLLLSSIISNRYLYPTFCPLRSGKKVQEINLYQATAKETIDTVSQSRERTRGEWRKPQRASSAR